MAAGSGVGLFDTGIDDPRMKELGKTLPHGGAALCVLVAEADWPTLRERTTPYVGELLVVELTPEAEAALGAGGDQPGIAAAEEPVRELLLPGSAARRKRAGTRARRERRRPAHTRERKRTGQARLDEAEPARRERDHPEERGGDVREQHERGPWLRPDGLERRDEREVVEEPLPYGRRQRHLPAEPEGRRMASRSRRRRSGRSGPARLPQPERGGEAPAQERSGRSNAKAAIPAASMSANATPPSQSDCSRLRSTGVPARIAGTASRGKATQSREERAEVAVMPEATQPPGTPAWTACGTGGRRRWPCHPGRCGPARCPRAARSRRRTSSTCQRDPLKLPGREEARRLEPDGGSDPDGLRSKSSRQQVNTSSRLGMSR